MKIHGKILTLFAALLLLSTRPAAAQGDVWVLDIQGAIGPAVADYMVRGLEDAQAESAQMVVLRIDTPGGLDSSMRDMIQAILASRVPVVGYVSPQGARAASAGTYILYASHIAAMAPATNLGAATPVQIGGTPSLPGMPEEETPGDSDTEEQPQEGVQPSTAMERKIINDATAYIQGLAELRGRNADWAKRAVTEGVSLSSAEALELNVINLVATDLGDLLQKLDGRQIEIADNNQVALDTADAAIHEHPVDWRSQFLAVITNPNVAYILVMIGIYGLIFEFSNPGMGVPGVVGAVCLLLAMYAFQVLPVSYAGLALILLGIALMVAEAFAPSFGILGLGGVVAFAIGSIILMDTELPGYQIAMPLIAGFTAFSAVLLIVALGLVLKARKSAVVSGLETLIGKTAVVESLRDGEAYIWLEGERWHVQSPEALEVNDSVRILDTDGVLLKAEKIHQKG